MKKFLCAVLCAALLLGLPATAQAAELGIHPDRYLHDQRHDADRVEMGIDVSQYQGQIDWARVADADVQFAFVRIGGRYSGSGAFYDDTYFDANLAGAVKNGIPVGVYFFSQATTEAEAREEAQYVLDRLGDRAGQLSLPVMLDMEYVSGSGRAHEADLSRSQAAEIALAFCGAVADAGLQAGVYTGFVTYPLDGDAVPEAGYTVWHAHWTDETTYRGWYDIWQVSDSGSVPGIEGRVDVNFRYVPATADTPLISAVYLSDKTLSLTAGESAHLAAAFSPSNAADRVRWRSSDPTVAYVDPACGTVTGVRPGSVEIIAGTGSGVSAVCRVTVTQGQTQDNSIVIADAAPQRFTGSAATTNVTVCTVSALAGGQAVTTGEPLNLRLWPSTQYAAAAQLPYGTQVSILAAVRDGSGRLWCAVEAPADGETVRGFVVADSLRAITGVQTLEEGRDYTLTYSSNTAAGTAYVTAAAAGSRCSGTATGSFFLFDWSTLCSRNSASALASRMGLVTVSGALGGEDASGWAAKDEQFVTICRGTDDARTLLRNGRAYTEDGGKWTVSVYADSAAFHDRFAKESAALITDAIEGEKIVSVSQRDGALTVTTCSTPADGTAWAARAGSGSTLTRVWTVDAATLQITSCSAAVSGADGQSRPLGTLTVRYGEKPDDWSETFALIHPDDAQEYTVVSDPDTENEAARVCCIDRDAVFRYLPAGSMTGPFANKAGTRAASGERTQYVFSACSFDDVTEGSWYYDSVSFAVSRGLFRGVSDTQFQPSGAVTREMFVTVLYRMAGEPAPAQPASFTDVAAGAWYADAVAWAAENGISNGSGDGSFGVGAPLTREQMAVLLYRFCASDSGEAADRSVLQGFADAGSVSDWAADAMCWAVSQQLIGGMSDTQLAPQATCSRAQAAAILQRYVNLS